LIPLIDVLDIILEINSLFDERVIQLKKNLSIDEFNQRLDELQFIRKTINQIFKDSL
jgi:hypothetical protein